MKPLKTLLTAICLTLAFFPSTTSAETSNATIGYPKKASSSPAQQQEQAPVEPQQEEQQQPEEAEKKGVPEIEPLPEIPGSKEPEPKPEDPTFSYYKWTPGGIYWGVGTTENVPIETVFKQTYMTNVLTPDVMFRVWKEHDPAENRRDYYNGPQQDPADKAENPGYGFML